MLYFKRFFLAFLDVTMKAELLAATKFSSKILQILYVEYVRISLRRLNYSNYAPNTPQWQRSACQ